MKLVSWNVAGFRACLKKGFEDFFYTCDADVYCLQEVKAELDQIDFEPKDYYCYINPAEKKGYSGTLIYTLYKPISVTYGIGVEEHDHEGRVITLEFEDYYLVNQYVPNVKRDLSRLDYRMTWEEDLKKYLKKLEEKKPVVICGDFNVAHTKKDIKNRSWAVRTALERSLTLPGNWILYSQRNCLLKLCTLWKKFWRMRHLLFIPSVRKMDTADWKLHLLSLRECTLLLSD